MRLHHRVGLVRSGVGLVELHRRRGESGVEIADAIIDLGVLALVGVRRGHAIGASAARSYLPGAASYSTSTRCAAARAASKVSATTSAIA